MNRPLESCCGPWSGFWIQGWTRGNMRLKLDFLNGSVNGTGNDLSGDFEIVGIYSTDTDRVLFTKTYRWQSVDYSGLWDGQLIYGKWVLHDNEYSDEGEFEIWPDKDEEFLHALSGSAEDMRSLPGG
jgi:hypothetical protein